VGCTEGASYNPAGVMVPYVLLPPRTEFTKYRTSFAVGALESATVNWSVLSGSSVAEPGFNSMPGAVVTAKAA